MSFMVKNKEIDPYEVIRGRYESNVKNFILSDLFNSDFNPDNELVEDIKNNKIVIYTAFTGDYDSLKEPDFIDDNCDYVCFSDNPNLSSDTWKIIPMEESTLDNNRKAKQYKVLPHKYFPDYKYSFWLDGTFKIKGSIREYIYKYINSLMLCVVHPERDCIFDEAESSIQFERYSNFTINKQVKGYADMGMPKHYGLPVLGAIFREHNNSEIIELMNEWWDEIIHFTNQDQLSLTYLMWKHEFHPSVAPIYYWINEYWTKEGKYHHKEEVKDYISSRNLIKSLKENIKDKNKLSKEEILLLFNDIDALKDEAHFLNVMRNNIDNELISLRNSSSWKITKPLRKLANLKKSDK